MNEQLASDIKELAQEIGYVACGITSARPFNTFGRTVRDLIKRFPEAESLYGWMLNREDPRIKNPWARSIVVCIRHYGKYRLPKELVGHIGLNYLFDLRYEESPDHAMPKRMTDGLKKLRLRTRKGGVPDKAAASRAGATRFGKNCIAYCDGYGSWINIETWLVDVELPADVPSLRPLCPPGCRKCIDACPTGALVEPYRMRMDRCIAHLTYSSKGPVEPGLWDKMGEWIYGCDLCQQVCPLNHDKWEEEEDATWLEKIEKKLTPEALAGMDEATYRNVVHPLFWYIPKNDLHRWHENARRALEAKSRGKE